MLSKFFILIIVLNFQMIFAENKRFVIDICSYNNSEWCERNLKSVFAQDYQDYRIIYTNDCSSDDTAVRVEKLAKRYGNGKITIIHNNDRQRMLANHWHVIHSCDDDEIIIHLDGDDWFAHEHVLSFLNDVYQDEGVWMTYGSYQFWPSMEKYEIGKIPQKVVDNNSYRRSSFRKSPYHLRSFYAWLGKRVQLKDLIFEQKPFAGQFTPAISDWSLLYPLFEMAHGRFKYIDEVLYSFNVINPLNHDKKKEWVKLQKNVRHMYVEKNHIGHLLQSLK